ncbi:hypothetical protein PIL02S_02082 [Paenibacillus illinoisensis]|jgi:hypothetical protein|uniref:Uncharacterized protein n=1 Tax=Paenibacillus illinoisensis TaxID=59845 RepID=A0A2W0C8B5_9BACL|nr:hypothetical protein PIL02S_02082 [Paenibacillus illinoisensis]
MIKVHFFNKLNDFAVWGMNRSIFYFYLVVHMHNEFRPFINIYLMRQPL